MRLGRSWHDRVHVLVQRLDVSLRRGRHACPRVWPQRSPSPRQCMSLLGCVRASAWKCVGVRSDQCSHHRRGLAFSRFPAFLDWYARSSCWERRATRSITATGPAPWATTTAVTSMASRRQCDGPTDGNVLYLQPFPLLLSRCCFHPLPYLRLSLCRKGNNWFITMRRTLTNSEFWIGCRTSTQTAAGAA